MDNDLHFDAAAQQGVVFHLIGASSEFGSSALSVSRQPLERRTFFHDTVAVLNRETRGDR